MPPRWSCWGPCCWSTRPRLRCACTCVRERSGNMDAALQVSVQDLRLAYGPKEVIKGISFDIRRNEIFGVIGPAQSGKTSLLRCLNRTIDFTADTRVSGSVLVDGEDVSRTRNIFALRRKIGM